jgi:hypothetical protein
MKMCMGESYEAVDIVICGNEVCAFRDVAFVWHALG